jgi:threonyl-tRNA synthetase
MLHRTIYGSLERFVGILIEHFNGRFPLWLAPEQVRVLNFTDRNTEYSQKIFEEIQKQIPDLRISCDFKSTTISAKVKDAEIMRVPYIIVIGDKEEKEGKLAVRVKGSNQIETISLEEFIKNITQEIRDKK